MSELDDLAKAGNQRQAVDVRRFASPEARTPRLVVQPSRSSFLAGFWGTFGVFAAIAVIALGVGIYFYVIAQMQAADLETRRRETWAAEQHKKIAEANAIQARIDLDAELQRWKQARTNNQAALIAVQRAAWRSANSQSARAFPENVQQAELAIQVTGKSFGDEIDYFVWNASFRNIGGGDMLIVTDGATIKSVKIPPLNPDQNVLCTEKVSTGGRQLKSLSFKIQSAYFSPAP